MTNFDIVFYTKPDGSIPAKDFIVSLNPKMRAKTLRTIRLLSDNGYKLREPYSKVLRDGILELRIKVGSDITRVLYFFYEDKRIILTHGFIKKTQQTPDEEINRAIRYRNDYIGRR